MEKKCFVSDAHVFLLFTCSRLFQANGYGAHSVQARVTDFFWVIIADTVGERRTFLEYVHLVEL